MWRSGLVFVLGISVAIASRADETEEAAAQAKEQREREIEQLTRLVPDYTFRENGDAAEPFELMTQPLLRWSNPVRKTRDGAVYLWLDRGRPAVIMSAFWSSDTEYKHEFQSLHQQSFTGRLDGEVVWAPREEGVEFAAVPGAPNVASHAQLRLIQMRKIAAAHRGSIGAVEEPQEQLRLLSQPLYRYKDPQQTPGLVDGAIFALVQTTDPEILVLLEARENSAGAARWYMAFARMSRWKLHVRRSGETVWSVPWGPGNLREPYRVLSHHAVQRERADSVKDSSVVQ